MHFQSIGVVGYIEVGKIFSGGLKHQVGPRRLGAWDLKFANPLTQAAEQAHAVQAGVVAQPSARALCEASELIISAVIASNTLAVSQEAAQYIRPGSVFLDLNSALPGTNQRCAALMASRGAQYVEAGVVTSVPPYGIRTPMLLGGPGCGIGGGIGCLGHGRQGRQRKTGSGQRHQDVPQRDDQGAGSAGH